MEKVKRILDSDWTWGIITAIALMLMWLCYTPTTYAQSVKKVNSTTIVVKTEQTHAKQDTTMTKYRIVIDDVVYPVYMNVKSGSMFIVRTSRKTGKQYRCYTIKGKKIKDMF